jgi:hypothetical protein
MKNKPKEKLQAWSVRRLIKRKLKPSPQALASSRHVFIKAVSAKGNSPRQPSVVRRAVKART